MSQNTPSPRLFIGSLPYKYSEGELLSLFISEGKIVAVRIIKNRWGKSRGMGYVEFENLEDAIRAKQKFHNYRLPEVDRTIIVDYAQPDPLNTPEGQARHQEAQAKRHKNRPSLAKNTSHNSRPSQRSSDASLDYAAPPFVRGVKKGQKIRPSVYKTRAYGSKIGAKFASRNKKKKS